jgi:membrane protein involved in colicin uptake
MSLTPAQARRARKKENRRNGERADARRRAHAEFIAAQLAREAAETAEVDDFLGGPLPKSGSKECQ